MIRMDEAQLESVLRPKILGAWTLHEALADKPLDFFVLFSSVSSVVVTAGQGNYAAGNAFLDALAHHRRGRGLPALSINWGPWNTGMIAELGAGGVLHRPRARPDPRADRPRAVREAARLGGDRAGRRLRPLAHADRQLSHHRRGPSSIWATRAPPGPTGRARRDRRSRNAWPRRRPRSIAEILADGCAEIIGGVLRMRRTISRATSP